MPTHARLADLAVNEVMETQDEVRRMVRVIDEALADGVITLEEAQRIRDQAAEVKREADEDVIAAERANIGELIAVAGLTGTYSPRLLKLAADVDLDVMLAGTPVVRLADYREADTQPA